ncbi:hypothetical protein [uncultured Sphingomonas sp.]|uniref:hypothetical protein n=1 Tax=uncultured Sphingomonas sp. TaxID=158754 RepID=UPI0025EDEB8F|nr:hypothetical protein [uncultured Sphingomonas sp.]
MPLGKLREDYHPIPTAMPQHKLGVDVSDHDARPVPSPALLLQEQLARTVATQPSAPAIRKWSPRASIALIISASAALWFAIIMAAAQVVHAAAPVTPTLGS